MRDAVGKPHLLLDGDAVGKLGGWGILAVSGNEQGRAEERYEVYRKYKIRAYNT